MSEQSPSGTVDPLHLARALRAPAHELTRSPAALRVAELAAQAGLFLFDYEQRVQLELPEAWLPIGRPDLGVTGRPPTWERGLLGESKYLSFRHDLLLGSLHPGHRAKWTAHELCHGLVGFCWRPDGSLLFHALAARAAEALPVALWYFFDEANLSRCARHADQREVSPTYCAACERAASAGPREDPSAREWTERGLAFLSRELDAVRRSAASGQPIFTPHAAIDLMTDGVAYASAHAPRLRAPETQSVIVHGFGAPGAHTGWFDDLAAFVSHIEGLGAWVAGVGPRPATLGIGRTRIITQDLGARLMQIAADTDGECFAALSQIWTRLAERADDAAITRALEGYTALHEELELPAPEEVFALGYPLAGLHGAGIAQLAEGLRSAIGATMARLEPDAHDLVTRFIAQARPSREPLGRRFAEFLAAMGADPELVGLARLEAAIAACTPPDPIELGLGLDGALAETLTLPAGVELVRTGFDAGGLLMHGHAEPDGPRSFLVRRDAGDEVGLVALSEGLAERLGRGPLDAAEVVARAEGDPELRALLEEGLLVPDRWELTVSTTA